MPFCDFDNDELPLRKSVCAECGEPIEKGIATDWLEPHVIDEDEFHEWCCPECMMYENGVGPRKHQWAHDVASIVVMCAGVAVLVIGIGVFVSVIEKVFR